MLVAARYNVCIAAVPLLMHGAPALWRRGHAHEDQARDRDSQRDARAPSCLCSPAYMFKIIATRRQRGALWGIMSKLDTFITDIVDRIAVTFGPFT